jgi:penicillin-binding protein 2
MGEKTGVDLPSESKSILADRKWKKSWYEQNKDFYCNYSERTTKAQQTPFLVLLAKENCLDGDKIRAGDAVNFSIGQGDTVITPIKLAQMYGAIANGGTIWKPTVAKAIVDNDGKVIKRFEKERLGNIGINQEMYDYLHEALYEVTVSGTAAGAFSGFPIATSGKTGTAQVFGKNPNGRLKDDSSWYASFAPAAQPRYVAVFMVSQGGFGASTSGFAVRKIYETLFGVKGGKVDQAASLFPSGKPPVKLPKISPATRPAGEKKK